MVNNIAIKQTNSAPLLGIKINNNLKHHQTIANIINKLHPTIHSFTYANKLLPTYKMKELYYTHIYPHLIGNISIWGTNNPRKTYIQPLIKIHKKIIRIIKNLPPRTHTLPLMNNLQILTIPNLYTLRVCMEIHPYIHPRKQLNRPEHNHKYTPITHIHKYPTRYATNKHYYIPNPNQYSKHKQPKHTIEHLTGKYAGVWNTLPTEIRNISSRAKFKTNIKHYLLIKQKKQAKRNQSRHN